MSVNNYNFKEIEEKYFNQSYKVKQQPKKKSYILEMMPYPSGRIHVGHVRNYTIGDIYSRYKLAQGYDVLHPMCWDAFGLPAENAAIKNNTHPNTWTRQNIKNMRESLQKLGFAYDWDLEFATCDEDYYKNTQRLFIQLYEKGLLYLDEAEVNWDPVEETVLANEQVIDGKGWRSGAVIERKKMKHWFIKITDYAQDLIDGLEELDWPESVKIMQKNWIGKSVGCMYEFDVVNESDQKIDKLSVFTTKPHTIFAGTFCGISTSHDLLKQDDLQNKKQIEAFIEKEKNKTVEEKRTPSFDGEFTGLYALNPYTNQKMPIYVCDYVLPEYGAGAVFACPAHDDRDMAFAKKKGVDMPVVIKDGIMCNSDFLNGLDEDAAFEKIIDDVLKNNYGKKEIFYRLRDWGISRQRYWGCPIPMIHCKNCGDKNGVLPVDDKDLPVILPIDIDLQTGGNVLAKDEKWKKTICHKCGSECERETETMDTFVDSSWYFLRYAYLARRAGERYHDDGTENKLDKKDDLAFDQDDIDAWMPVDVYIGGIEHAILHLLYARFFTKALNPKGDRTMEPFKKLFSQGMVCSNTYYIEKEDGRKEYVYTDDVISKNGKHYVEMDGKEIEVCMGPVVKMSKSLKNDVNLDQLISAYGADTIRLAVMSDSPPEQALIWTQENLLGCWRFINRINGLFEKIKNGERRKQKDDQLNILLQKSISGITQDIEDIHCNTYIAKLRILFNAMEESFKKGSDVSEELRIFAKLANPVVPFLSSYIWDEMNVMLGYEKENILEAAWPKYDESAIEDEEVVLVVQIKGKVRANVKVKKSISEDEMKKIAADSVNLDLSEVKRVILVKDRFVVNFVV